MFNKKLALVLDDHTIFAEAFSKTLQGFNFFESVIPFSNERDFLQYLIQLRDPRSVYLFLDYYLGETLIPGSLSEVRRILKKPKIIIVSGIVNPILITNLLDLRPDGIIHKSESTSEILKCIHFIEDGQSYYSGVIKEIIDSRVVKDSNKLPFTPREMELLMFFARGVTVEQTAEYSNLSPHTVSAHRRKMFVKAKVNNISELLAYARKFDLI